MASSRVRQTINRCNSDAMHAVASDIIVEPDNTLSLVMMFTRTGGPIIPNLNEKCLCWITVHAMRRLLIKANSQLFENHSKIYAAMMLWLCPAVAARHYAAALHGVVKFLCFVRVFWWRFLILVWIYFRLTARRSFWLYIAFVAYVLLDYISPLINPSIMGSWSSVGHVSCTIRLKLHRRYEYFQLLIAMEIEIIETRAR